MNIQGVARVLLTVAPDGKVSDVKSLVEPCSGIVSGAGGQEVAL